MEIGIQKELHEIEEPVDEIEAEEIDQVLGFLTEVDSYYFK